MPRRFPLQPLYDLARDAVEAATQRMAILKKHWQLQEDKLKQLQGFQVEYQQRLGQAMRQGLDMAAMRDYQIFLRKIDVAIKQQMLEVERGKTQWENGQSAWLEARRKLKTYEVLSRRHQQAQNIIDNRLEQREQDEYARRRDLRFVKEP